VRDQHAAGQRAAATAVQAAIPDAGGGGSAQWR
jgi:hypothetical protein